MDSEMLAHLKSCRLLWVTFISNFFSHDRSKKALGNHSTRLGDGKLELFPGLSFIYLIFVKPHKHICVNFCPVWIFTELTEKIWHFDRFTQTSGIFTDLTQKVDAFGTSKLFYYDYRVDSLCFIVFMFMFILVYHVYYADLLCLSCWAITL